jgi:hypothetical protein
VAEIIAAALSDPQQLGQPFAYWTLDCLEGYLNEEKKIEIKRSRIDELLIAERNVSIPLRHLGEKFRL